jgi:hypothetical protein
MFNVHFVFAVIIVERTQIELQCAAVLYVNKTSMSSSKLFGTATSIQNSRVQRMRVRTLHSGTDCTLPIVFKQ